MEYMYNIFPKDLVNFAIVLAFSLLIGLSQRKHFLKQDITHIFGSDRTYSLIGILGYVMYILRPESMIPYIFGGVFLFVLTCLYYNHKLNSGLGVGATSSIINMLCYGLAPLTYEKDLWVVTSVVVSILILNEMKESFINFTKKINDEEFINLGKFLIIAGVILPTLPHKEIIEGYSISPYSIWLTTVVISGFSYISYLLKHYILNKSGLLVSGFLGGLYSSTATCVILAKKAEQAKENEKGQYVTATFCAISTLYIKYLVLLSVFNTELLSKYWYIFITMFFVGLAVAGFFHFKDKQHAKPEEEREEDDDKNPLEFKVALLFALLFVIFTFLTSYTIQQFGDGGLRTLSIIVGISDITPFVLNLFQAEYAVSESLLMLATFQAIISNNIVKMVYGIVLSKNKIAKPLIAGFSVITAANVLLLLFTL